MSGESGHPSLVLHVCCAPDEAWVVHSLRDRFRLHCFFCNPNIQPAEEYAKRLDEARGVAVRFGVEFDEDPYAPSLWEEAVRGLEDSGEGGPRCAACFLVRLRRTALFCRERGFLSFATVMSISPHKSLRMLNEAGQSAAGEFGIRFEVFDFKKRDGFLNSVRLSRELGLYRQDYCGCRLSKDERSRRIA